jgi:hypothetical protein
VKRTPELYNLADDIAESKNLADEHPLIVQKLTRAAEQHKLEIAKNARPVGRSQDATGTLQGDRGASDKP